MSAWKKHEVFEKNSFVLLIGILVMVAIGGLVEIAPLFYLKSTIEKTEGRSSGAPSGPARIWPASAANTPTTGMWST